MYNSYRGYGDPLIGFWPYFRHEYSSGGISAVFELIAGTLTVLFTLFFLEKKKSNSRNLLLLFGIEKSDLNQIIWYTKICIPTQIKILLSLNLIWTYTKS